MGSVEVTWRGRCPDRAAREDLLAHMRRLADLSHGFYPTPPRWIQYDHVVEGRIVVMADVGFTGRAWSSGFRSDRVERLRRAGGEVVRRAGRPPLVRFRRLRLHGAEFRLRHDPPDLDDVASFVFVCGEPGRVLDGALVQVVARSDFPPFRSRAMRSADLILKNPAMTLRRDLESWIDLLLAWVKSFGVETLRYWRHDDLIGFDAFRRYLLERGGREQASLKEPIFDLILDSFAATRRVEAGREGTDPRRWPAVLEHPLLHLAEARPRVVVPFRRP